MSGTEGADIITNDDAVVDCIVYACESRNHGIAEDQRARLTRRVAAAGPDNVSGKECSITMCGNDDDPSNQLLQYCENGHCLHDVCIEYIFDKAESLSTAVCPQCRSQRMIYLVTRAKPIESESVTRALQRRSSASPHAKRLLQLLQPLSRQKITLHPPHA